MHIIDEDTCIGCAACAGVCPDDAIDPKDAVYVITDKCTDCGTCVESCPVSCIAAG